MRSPTGVRRSSKGRWARRLFFGTIVVVLLMAGIAQADNLGWWGRAYYNGYALCGYEYTTAIPWPTPPAYGATVTETHYTGVNSCYPENAVTATQYSGAALWFVTGYDNTLCGTGSSGYSSTVHQTAVAINTACPGWHGFYVVCMQVGGYITGAFFSESHYPVCTNPTYY
jgi:hypothetical protein